MDCGFWVRQQVVVSLNRDPVIDSKTIIHIIETSKMVPPSFGQSPSVPGGC